MADEIYRNRFTVELDSSEFIWTVKTLPVNARGVVILCVAGASWEYEKKVKKNIKGPYSKSHQEQW